MSTIHSNRIAELEHLRLPQDLGSGLRTIYVVLPAFNEEENLGPLLKRVYQILQDKAESYQVIVVDDGSSDSTYAITQRYAKYMPLSCLRHQTNAGLGKTIADGLFHASQQCEDDDIIVALDADNSHNPGLISRMVMMIDEGNDVVIASRYQNGSQIRGVPWYRNLLSLGARYICQLTYPIPGVRDYTCGFRAYRGKLLKDAFAMFGKDGLIRETGFQCMLELLINLHKMGAVCNEVPMILRYDQKGGVSKMRVARTMLKTLKVLAQARMR